MEVLKKRQRFSDHDDLVLLREVLSHNPFENPALWSVIQENLLSLTGKTFSIRTLKEHLNRLIKLWLDMFKTLKDKSGIEVIYTGKDTLCNNIYDMMKEFENRTKKKSISLSKKLGITARNNWTQMLDGSIEDNSLEPSILHDHGGLSLPVEEIIIDFVEAVDSNSQEKMQAVNEHKIENTEPNVNKASTSAHLSTPNKKLNVSHHTQKQISASEPPTPNSKPAKILGAVKSRKRKANTQRQGLAYLEQYDKQQSDIKKNNWN